MRGLYLQTALGAVLGDDVDRLCLHTGAKEIDDVVVTQVV